MYFIELIGFIQYYGVLKRPFLKECVPKKCREIYAQIPPQVGFVPPHLYPPYGGDIYPHGKISMANPVTKDWPIFGLLIGWNQNFS